MTWICVCISRKDGVKSLYSAKCCLRRPWPHCIAISLLLDTTTLAIFSPKFITMSQSFSFHLLEFWQIHCFALADQSIDWCTGPMADSLSGPAVQDCLTLFLASSFVLTIGTKASVSVAPAGASIFQLHRFTRFLLNPKMFCFYPLNGIVRIGSTWSVLISALPLWILCVAVLSKKIH